MVSTASPSPRKSMGKARSPKKPSISELFIAASQSAMVPTGLTGGSEHREENENDDDESLQEIMPQEAPDKPDFPDGLDTRASKEPEGVQLLGKEKEKISDVNMQKKADSVNCIESKEANKVGKPFHSILKYTKPTSVKMFKEKHGSLTGTEVIELRRKSVERVDFSDANDILGTEMQSCKLPKQQSLQKLLSDDMASSSPSLSSSSSTGMSGEGNKCKTAESSSHRPKEARTHSREANKNTEHEVTPKLPFIDLNEALPESTDVDYTHDSPKLPLIDLNEALPESTDVDYTHDSQYVKRISGLVKLTPGANHLLVPSDSAGDATLYRCIPAIPLEVG